MTEPSTTEHGDPTATLPPPPPAPPAGQTPTAEPKVRRTLVLPVVAAVAVAALLIGGLAGGIIGYAVHSDGPDLNGRPGQGFRQGGPGQGFQGGPNGTMPQPPQQQDDSGSDSGSDS